MTSPLPHDDLIRTSWWSHDDLTHTSPWPHDDFTMTSWWLHHNLMITWQFHMKDFRPPVDRHWDWTAYLQDPRSPGGPPGGWRPWSLVSSPQISGKTDSRPSPASGPSESWKGNAASSRSYVTWTSWTPLVWITLLMTIIDHFINTFIFNKVLKQLIYSMICYVFFF